MWKPACAPALFLLALLSYPHAAGAVTDCSKPKSKIDWMICSNERAAGLEERMAIAFRGAMARAQNREQLLQEQKEWTLNVRDACNEVACLTGAYRARTEDLETY